MLARLSLIISGKTDRFSIIYQRIIEIVRHIKDTVIIYCYKTVVSHPTSDLLTFKIRETQRITELEINEKM